jgi:hypothetical protein
MGAEYLRKAPVGKRQMRIRTLATRLAFVLRQR